MLAVKGLLGQFEKQIKRWIDRAFRDPNLVRTITWDLYKGRSAAVESFTTLAVCVAHTVGESEIADGVAGQQGKRTYLIRESDLPVDITKDALTKNDVITDGATELRVAFLDKTLEFVIMAEALGGS